MFLSFCRTLSVTPARQKTKRRHRHVCPPLYSNHFRVVFLCAWQLFFTAQHTVDIAASEDCLQLNIFKPAGSVRALPIMVYLFGGGLCGGFAANKLQDGTILAHRCAGRGW